MNNQTIKRNPSTFKESEKQLEEFKKIVERLRASIEAAQKTCVKIMELVRKVEKDG